MPLYGQNRIPDSIKRKIKELEEIKCKKLYDNPQITYWRWDRRQPWRTVDRVHLTYRGYSKAIKYLMAKILWMDKHIPKKK